MKHARRWVGGIVAVTVIALIGGWAGVHRLHRALPPPIWTEADLPTPAPLADDGWTVLATVGSGSHVDTHATELCVPGGDATFADVVAEQMDIRRAVLDPGAVRELLASTAVFDHPRLTDRCPLSNLVECPAFTFHRLHRVAELDTLGLALDGEWDRALERTEHVLRADDDLLRHARGMVTQVVALLDARNALTLLSLLVDGLANPPDGPSAPPSRASLRPRIDALLATLDALAANDADGSRMVIGEYIRHRADVDLVTNEPAAIGAGLLQATMLFDARMTVDAIDAHYRDLERFARHPGSAPPASADARASGTWWGIWNPVGRTLLMLDPDLTGRLTAFARDRAALRRECAALRPRLLALRE